MARSRHNRSRGKEIWASRRNSKKVRGGTLNRYTKTRTHRNERRDGRGQVKAAVAETYEPLSVFEVCGLMWYQAMALFEETE